MTAGVPQPVKGTKFEFKATSGGTFAEVINCMARRIPTPQAETEDFTPIWNWKSFTTGPTQFMLHCWQTSVRGRMVIGRSRRPICTSSRSTRIPSNSATKTRDLETIARLISRPIATRYPSSLARNRQVSLRLIFDIVAHFF